MDFKETETDRRCISLLTNKIANGENLTNSEVLDFSHALANYFNYVSSNSKDDNVRESAKLLSLKTQQVNDELGFHPGYKHKYQWGLTDRERLNLVRNDYKVASKQHGIFQRPDFKWRA